MPVKVRRKRPGESGKPWKIVEKSGRVVGQSSTAENARASARARNAAHARKKKR